MSNSLHISKYQLRDGASQRLRMPKALQPGYITVDERSREDLISFARTLAAEIRYYNAENQPESNWDIFFTDDIPDSTPHKALFLCFLELFKYAQEHMNTLTERHLDFYYKEVLRLEEKPATPDQAHVLFQLAKNVKSHLLEAGTLMKAGKDKNGNPLHYAIEKDIVLNKTAIGSLKTLFIEKNDNKTQNIFAAPVANSEDGLGISLEDENPQWEIFGSPEKGEQAAIGFAVASPLLFLKEGERTIEMLLTCQDVLPETITGTQPLDMAEMFEIQLSGQEQWIKSVVSTSGREATAYRDALTNQQFGLTIAIEALHPPVTAYNAEVLGSHFHTSYPIMKTLVKDHNHYDLLKNIKLVSATLRVDVTGVKDLVLQNDHGMLDPSRAFLPFGARPSLGAAFYMGSAEVFQKKLDSLALHMIWQDLPEDFTAHYGGYGAITSADFTARLNLLYRQSWSAELSPAYMLFDNGNEITGIPAMLQAQQIDYQHRQELQSIKKYDNNTQGGFIRLELTGPSAPFKAFGHTRYPHLYTQQAIALSKYDIAPEDPDYNPPAMPNEPYTPTLKSLSLDYTSTQEIGFQGSGDAVKTQFFHIGPFGHHEWSPDPDILEDSPGLLPKYTDEGTLYIGLTDLHPPQQLSILFRPAEGSAAPDNNIRQEDIRWSYLSNNNWIPFKAQEILSDTTKAFQDTGIITLNIPRDASLQHSLMSEGLHWLKASVVTGAEGAGKLIALDTQAVIANFTDQSNDPSRLSEALPSGSISKLAERQAAVRSITQPYPSFNGKPAEHSEAFYTRISERLRHKARAVSSWDYERMILEKFPSIYKVKCLNHTSVGTENITAASLATAGCVTLITLPGPEHKNAADPLEPKTSNKTLIAIEEHIQKYTSSFVTVAVKNPRYEQLQLRFEIRFAEGTDQGYHQKLLEEELIRFLSPWAYEDEEDIVFGNEIYKSDILDFVEKRPYVDFVTDFVLYHIFEATLPGEDEDHPVEGEQNTHHILHRYSPASGKEIAIDFVVGFDESSVAGIPGLRPDIDVFFDDLGATGSLDNVQRANVMTFLETHEEVAFVRDLRLFHIEEAQIVENAATITVKLKEDTEKAVAARPDAILTSAKTHEIALVDMSNHECPGIKSIGIGYMVVQGDFIIS